MFIAKSNYLKKIKNIATLAKDLKINVYIWGNRGVGKTFLAKYIASNGVINPSTSTINPIIIEDFDKQPIINFNYSFLVATGSKPLSKSILKKYFNMDIELKPLKEHKEDIEAFINHFINQAKNELKIKKEISILNPDISENLNSLKKQIYNLLLTPTNKQELFNIIKSFYENFDEEVIYEEEINSFEKALFSAMRKKYKSKLQIANHLKINRVTLTKKMKALNV